VPRPDPRRVKYAPALTISAPAVIDILDLSCPISLEVLVDPVTASDGHTYERGCIAAWLRIHETSPMTGEPMAHKSLMRNYDVLRLLALSRTM
jgi:hypothetical protein